LFQGGHYPDKGVTADSAFLDALVAGTRAAEADPKFDIEHLKTEGILPFGRVLRDTVRRSYSAPPGGQPGDWVIGEVEVEQDVERHLTARGLSVTLPRTLDAITKVAVTATPRVPGAQFNSEPGEGPTFAEGYLMPETPIATPPEAPAEETRIAGIVGAVLSKLGLGHKPEAEAAPTPLVPAPAFTAADIDAKLAAQEATFKAQIDAANAKADAAAAKAREQEVAAFSATLATKGVPQFAIDALARHADTGEVTFSDADKPGEMDAPKAIRFALERLAGSVPMGRILPSNDASGHEVEFNDRVAAKADEIQAANPTLSKSAAYERAALEVK